MFFVIPVKVVPPYGAGELNGLNEKKISSYFRVIGVIR